MGVFDTFIVAQSLLPKLTIFEQLGIEFSDTLHLQTKDLDCSGGAYRIIEDQGGLVITNFRDNRPLLLSREPLELYDILHAKDGVEYRVYYEVTPKCKHITIHIKDFYKLKESICYE